MKTISFYTLGCRANQAETDMMADKAAQKGWETVKFGSPSDICVINTCTVTQLADKKSRQAIRKAVRSKKEKVIVTGCMVETDMETLKNIEGIDIILNNNDKKNILKCLPHVLPSPVYRLPATKVRANLLIQNGCENFCTYCIVPYARGKETSRDPEEIIKEANILVKNGTKEIVLTGINIGAFKDLPKLIGKLCKIKDLLRLRLSSIEPDNISIDLVETISKNEKVCRYMHIPLQSGDDEILNKMGRKYTSKEYYKLISFVRERVPDIAVSTDIITGFPGETDEQFNRTLNFIKKCAFTRLHIFRYSKRKGTPAADLKDQVPEEMKIKRSDHLHEIRNVMMLEYHKSLINKTLPVLAEQRDNKTGLLEGLTDTFVRVFFIGEDDLIGKIVPVKILKAGTEYVKGIIVG